MAASHSGEPELALAREVERRRTFAIISHPDAGKTTLTEKLLLYGGALRQAGAVRAQKASLINTTRLPALSSSGWKVRPSTGRTPKSENRPAETSAPSIRSGVSPMPKLTGVSLVAAIATSDVLRRRISTNSAGLRRYFTPSSPGKS